MSRFAIGGVLDMAGYAALAQLHRPTDPDQLATEVHRLHSSGLTAQDISAALQLAPEVIVAILAGQRESHTHCPITRSQVTHE